jgi:hypothetical protein
MGRPLNKKYFANTNYQDFGTAGVGGESVASVAVTGTFSGKTPGTYDIPASVISAPGVTGGAKPTLTLTIAAAGDAGTVTVVTAGSGYLTTATVSGAALQALGGAGTGTVVLTATMTSGAAARQNGIKCEAQVGAGSEVTTGDVIKQVSDIRYKVQTSDGTAVCKLVTTADLNANEMSIIATDSAGGTYFVKKLTARKVVLVPIDGTQFPTNADGTYKSAKWSFTTTIVDAQVTIANQ